MAISFVDSAFAVSSGNGTSINVTVPAHNADDLIILYFVSDGNSEVHTITDDLTSSLTFTVQGGRGDEGITTSWRWALATSESSTGFVITFTVGSSESQVIIVGIFRGVDTIDPTGVQLTGKSVSDQTPSLGAPGGQTANSWHVVGMAMDRDSVTVDGTFPTNLTGLFAKRDTGQAASQCGCVLGYDTTATDPDVYTWPSQDRADGSHITIVEILEAVALDNSLPIFPVKRNMMEMNANLRR